MKVEELMVGNIVGYIDDGQLVPVVVRKINGQDKIVCLRQSDGHVFNTMIDFLQPIPLTDEILIMNGIKYQFGNPWYQGVDLGKEGFAIHFGIHCQMQLIYLHELQNALRICKIDKQITLP